MGYVVYYLVCFAAKDCSTLLMGSHDKGICRLQAPLFSLIICLECV